jgi:ADP-ribose pyrophosphatase YjhB (NUDIX family)
MIKKVSFFLWRYLPMPGFLRFLILWVVNPKYLVTVDALIFNQAKECLLFHHPYRQDFKWGLPGGYLKRGEHPEAAIQREINEESGMDIHNQRLLDIDMPDTYPRMSLIYQAELKGEFNFTPSVEVSEARFFHPKNLPPLFPNQVDIIKKYTR